jgi:hypothetical protein
MIRKKTIEKKKDLKKAILSVHASSTSDRKIPMALKV